jgi:uncharacterized protein (DUF2126 family)
MSAPRTHEPRLPIWMTEVSTRASARFAAESIDFTLGGEPTFVPIHPKGSEWSVAAVGPTKLGYARTVARNLLKGPMRGGCAFFCPGKLYPGEVNPRWAVRLLARRDGASLLPEPGRGVSARDSRQLGEALTEALGICARWLTFDDPTNPGSTVSAIPLDHDGKTWRSKTWNLGVRHRRLLAAEGPAGLRLPLEHFPAGIPKRALTIEWQGRFPTVFFPPLLREPFLELLAAAGRLMAAESLETAFSGYLPPDIDDEFLVVGLTADPGVLEVNLPVCRTWEEYAGWQNHVTTACASAGLRPWKEPRDGFPEGTGGGNHILWGGPSLERNPFFTRPGWLATILRTFQRHPSLAYVFTGCYVGPSSQAPRPDESARSLDDLEMAYQFLASLPRGDHRSLINETLRHLHTDLAGNTHRSEISFDKFWNPGWPGGALGLIEFRAFESLPDPQWSSAAALLLSSIAAAALDQKQKLPLVDFGTRLHDRYFLPTVLWHDLTRLLDSLEKSGFSLRPGIYRKIWEWRFPQMLSWKRAGCHLTVRKALEGWPLLCETPLEGGTTSRFVDTSMHRLEFSANPGFAERFEIYAAGRPLPLKPVPGCELLAGLRFRRTNWHPSLHPGITPHIPLDLCLVEKKTARAIAEFSLGGDDHTFQPTRRDGSRKLRSEPCRPRRRGEITCDLRLASA